MSETERRRLDSPRTVFGCSGSGDVAGRDTGATGESEGGLDEIDLVSSQSALVPFNNLGSITRVSMHRREYRLAIQTTRKTRPQSRGWNIAISTL